MFLIDDDIRILIIGILARFDFANDTTTAHIQTQVALGLTLDNWGHISLFLGEGVMEDHFGIDLSRGLDRDAVSRNSECVRTHNTQRVFLINHSIAANLQHVALKGLACLIIGQYRVGILVNHNRLTVGNGEVLQ